MAAKKKTKKKPAKSKKTSPRKRKANSTRKLAKRKLATKSKAPKKPAAKKSAAPKKAKAKKQKSRSVKTEPFLQEAPARRTSVQAGDLQGLSSVEGAASESVDELLEEGNAFEADAVKGVEDADDSDEQEVHTHEVPEDDVPGEYLDEE